MTHERMNKLREMITVNKYVNLRELVEVFGVSVSTIRRDLEALEKEGLCKRNHGGATLLENQAPHTQGEEFRLPVQLRNEMLKRAIAQEAAKFVNDGDFIAIGSGTTCLEFARELKNKKNLTVLTNNMFIAVELAFCGSIQVIASSGIIAHENNCVNAIGDYALDFFSQFHPEKAFCSVLAADYPSGYFDLDFKLRSVLEKMIDVSDRSYLLLDHTKFNNRGRVKIGELDRYDEIVTTAGIPEEYVKYYESASIPIHICAYP